MLFKLVYLGGLENHWKLFIQIYALWKFLLMVITGILLLLLMILVEKHRCIFWSRNLILVTLFKFLSLLLRDKMVGSLKFWKQIGVRNIWFVMIFLRKMRYSINWLSGTFHNKMKWQRGRIWQLWILWGVY